LAYVVIDEMHIYRGVFGSHMANVLRRLQRVCQFYGVQPKFVFCSATIANAQQLAEKLLGAPVSAITQSGAPQGEKHLLLWNPPMINAELGIRASARSQVTKIAKQAIQRGLKTIVFAQSRLQVEVITKYLKDQFDKDPRKPNRVNAYRGGYLPTQRRETEKKMRQGQTDCVVSTSALELGIDIGALDVCLLNGYPGTVAATWQRIGRVGRRQQSSLSVLVASSQPLDQFMVRNPEFFLGASPEHAQIDPDQLLILLDHIRCAAFELPFQNEEMFGTQSVHAFLEVLAEDGVVHQEGQQWYWMDQAYPANSVSLRSVAEGNFVVIDYSQGKQQIIAEVDFSAAPLTLYQGAIYLIQAQPYQVEKLDWEGRKAFVKPTKADYYTDAIDYTKLSILENFAHNKRRVSSVCHGEVHLVRRVAGYKKIRYYSHENIGFGKVNLPDAEMHTTSVWWQVQPHHLDQLFAQRWQALDGFLGAAYALHHVAALINMSEPRDLGRAVGNGESQWFATVDSNGRGTMKNFQNSELDPQDLHMGFVPTVFLYDNFPGGMGMSQNLFELSDRIVAQARELIRTCNCELGCPACIGPILPRTETSQSPKQAAIIVLEALAAP
ncbi:MAG: helicase-related protein, partial [Gammaproteobacteria bacterium]|nr:helicase-related protein [Gammaproteobacteria bacterium]